MALPALDFDLLGLKVGDSQRTRSSQSMMSIRDRSGSIFSHVQSAIGIDLPSSSMHGGSYQVSNDLFGASNLQNQGNPGHDIFDDEVQLFQDDMLFEFDADGQMRDIDIDERTARRASSVPGGRLGSDSAASGRVQKQHDDAQVLTIINGEDNFDQMDLDDLQMLPDAEAFPIMADRLNRSSQPHSQATDLEHAYTEEQSSVSAEATQKRYKPKTRKILNMDIKTELLNADLRTWQSKYLDNMIAESLLRINKIAIAQAKKNAMSYVFGAGLNGVGAGVGLSEIPSPLLMFSGEPLLSLVTGNPLPSPEYKLKKATKHHRGEEDLVYSPKRSRYNDQEPEPEPEDEIGRGFEDDGRLIIDDGIEVGRDAAEAMNDYHSSAIMPWNVSQSLNSHQRGITSSLPGRLPSIGSHRFTSASPLVGRGAPLPSDMGQFDMLDDDQILYGRDDNESIDDDAAIRKRDSQNPRISSSQAEAAEFEIYGPAAHVDTQTAAASEWVRDVLDRESVNFFDYVCNMISEKYGDDLVLAELNEGDKNVTFEELFHPNTNSKMVAAQAFYHVLSLATKNRVRVTQDVKKEMFKPFGDIRIGILA